MTNPLGRANRDLATSKLGSFGAYVYAVLFVGIATGLTLLLWPYNEHIPAGFYYLAVLLATRYGNARAAAVATILSGFLINYLFVPPFYHWSAHPDGYVTFGVFCVVSSAVIFLTERLQRAKKEQRTEREWWQTSLASIGDAVIATDVAGRVVFLNPVAQELIGWSQEVAIGKPLESVFRIVHEDTGEPLDNRVHRVVAGERPLERTDHTALISSDGRLRPIEEKADPIRDKNRIIGVVFVFRDITERKRAENAARQSEDRLDFALQVSGTGAWDLDLLDHTAHRSLQHDRIFGYQTLLPAWTYEVFLEHVLPEDCSEVDRLFSRAIADKGDWSFECRIRRGDGEVRWIWASGRHRFDESGVARRMSGIVQDITERKQAEEEIRLLNAELEQRVIKRTAELEAANKELEAFSYSVSHDLRAPLRTVDGFSQAVLEDYGPQLPEEGRRYLQTIRGGAQRMGALIDDLLTFSRLSRQPLNKQTVDTGGLVQDALDELGAEQRGREIEIRIGDLPRCNADPALLKQVWINLLSNALKYTRGRDPSIVEIGCTVEQSRKTYFVRDTGTGFDMRYAHKLFGVFHRLHRTEDFEGTGVGLAIVQRVIHRHGGEVWADAEVDRGATFYFTLDGGDTDERSQPSRNIAG